MKLKDAFIPALAIVVIAALTALALAKGINGALLMSSITLIAGVGGCTIGKTRKH